MVDNYENPFASVGLIAGGDQFLGRKRDLRAIESSVVVLPPRQRGCLAIIGLPQIGKDCLVNKALVERAPELHQKRLVPIRMDLKDYIQPDDFFRDLISQCKYTLEELRLATPRIKTLAREAGQEGLLWNETFLRIR